MEISQGDMIKHYEQIVRDVTSNVNNLRSDMMMRMQKIKDKLQKLGKKIVPEANFILDSSMEVRDELSMPSESDRAQQHQEVFQKFMKKNYPTQAQFEEQAFDGEAYNSLGQSLSHI